MYGYGYSLYNQVPFGRGGIDPAAAAYFTATGITGATQQTAIDNLVKGLKSDGLWSKMKAVYPFVTDNRNLLGYTEDFSNAAWLKVNVSVTANTTIAPDGTTTADTFQNTGVSGAFLIQKDIAKSAGTYTQSFYFKKNNNDWVAMYTSDNGANYAIAWFNVNTGVAGTVSAVGNFSAATSSITNVGSGWYRCSLTFTKPLTSLTDTSALVPVGDNSLSMVIGQNAFIWGAQLELGSTATTYQPIATTQQAFISSQFKYNLVNPVDSDAAFRLVFNGGWTHSANGATPNGTNGYADTFYSPSLNSTITNNHFMLYLPSVSIPSVITTDLGALSADYNSRFQTNYFQNPSLDTTNFDVRKRTSVSNSLIGSGCVIYSRSAINSAKVYFNNSIVANDTSNTLTYALPNITVYLAAGHLGTTAITYSNRRNCFTSLGDGLTDTEAANLYTRVQAFQTALSRQV